MSPLQPPHLSHPTLRCTLIGKPSSATIQYRGLQYATIPGRWQESVPLEFLSPNRTIDNGTVYDATKFGPSCPQKRGAQAWDVTLVGDNLTLVTEDGQGDGEKMDELGCLHVNVTVPTFAGRQKSNGNGLPVFIWVHGGGLSMGSNSWPQYDLRSFVERSVKIGKPVVGVSVNYRVGILGFLASEELGVGGNLGFKDLILALKWVKKHIHGFGGDPGNLTAAGESAGGIALSTILCSTPALHGEALLKRVVVMSGEVTLRKPRGRRWHEEMYVDQLKYLGLEEGKSAQGERMRRLREWDAEEMCQKLPLAQHFCGVVDGKWLKSEVTLGVLGDGESEVHKPRWCEEMVVGDMAHDGTILKARILDSPTALTRLHTLCSIHLTPQETHMLLNAYNLPLPPTSPPPTPQQSHALLLLASELRFYLPTLIVHQGWKEQFPSASQPATRASRYHFHTPNPFSGPNRGLASHELDVALLLQNFSHLIPNSSPVQKAANAMTDHFIGFANGEEWAESGEVVVFGEKGVERISEDKYDRDWRGRRGKVLKDIGAEKLWAVAEGWQGVRPEEGDRSRSRL